LRSDPRVTTFGHNSPCKELCRKSRQSVVYGSMSQSLKAKLRSTRRRRSVDVGDQGYSSPLATTASASRQYPASIFPTSVSHSHNVCCVSSTHRALENVPKKPSSWCPGCKSSFLHDLESSLESHRSTRGQPLEPKKSRKTVPDSRQVVMVSWAKCDGVDIFLLAMSIVLFLTISMYTLCTS
jgi:hypothetical protein